MLQGRAGEARFEAHPTRELAAMAAAGDFGTAVRSVLAIRETARVLFASAPSQREFFAAIARDKRIPWGRVDVFHLDDWVGLGPTHPASLGRFLRVRIPTPPARMDWIRGDARDPELECRRYAERLGEQQIDVACVGFGDNGHLAFNEPGDADPLDPRAVRVVRLDAASREQQVADGLFRSLPEVPDSALSVTVPTIMGARVLIAVVPGRRKAEAVVRALTWPVGEACPASFVRTHPAASVYLDQEAASLLPPD